MKKSIATILSILSILVFIVGVAPSAQADSSAALKSRMAKRLGQVVSLKKSGVVGENNQGYLTVRGSVSASQKALVITENADRRAVYQMIAAKTKKSISVVGKARAASIRKSTSKGNWIQLTSGNWKKL